MVMWAMMTNQHREKLSDIVEINEQGLKCLNDELKAKGAENRYVECDSDGTLNGQKFHWAFVHIKASEAYRKKAEQRRREKDFAATETREGKRREDRVFDDKPERGKPSRKPQKLADPKAEKYFVIARNPDGNTYSLNPADTRDEALKIVWGKMGRETIVIRGVILPIKLDF